MKTKLTNIQTHNYLFNFLVKKCWSVRGFNYLGFVDSFLFSWFGFYSLWYLSMYTFICLLRSMYIYVYVLLYFFLFSKVSGIPGWPNTLYITQAEHKLLILLSYQVSCAGITGYITGPSVFFFKDMLLCCLGWRKQSSCLRLRRS